ncbi:MAG: CsgG/HfaB family protein [Limisphaerales bacterium]
MKSNYLNGTWIGCTLVTLLLGCSSSQVEKKGEIVPLDAKELKHYKPLPMEQRKRLAVLQFEDRTDYGSGRLGNAAADVLTTFLDRSGQFALYEREQLDRILQEQNISASKPFDPSTAVAVGKTAGVQYVAIGAVTGFGFKSKRTQVGTLGFQLEQDAEATVDVRIIDVATGQIVAADSGRGIVAVKAGEMLGVGQSIGYDETIANNALRAAISQFVDTLIKRCR